MSQKKYRSRDYHGYLETVKTLPTWKEKLEYTWDNWKVLMIAIAFGIFFVVTMGVSIYNNSAPIYLNGEFVNVLSTDQALTYEEDYLDQAFLREYLGFSEDDRTRMLYNANLMLDFGDDSEAASTNYTTLTQVDLHMAAHEVDYFLTTEKTIEILDERYEAFWDLRDLLTDEMLERYADRLCYNETGIPVGIDITGSEIIEKMGLVAAEPVCLCWCIYQQDTSRILSFAEFILAGVE